MNANVDRLNRQDETVASFYREDAPVWQRIAAANLRASDAHAIDERTRYDMSSVKPPPAQAFAQLRQTFGAAADGIDNPNGRYSTPARMDPADLRTVQPVDLRTPQARVMDAQARDLRTAGDKIAELTARILELERHAEGVSWWEFEVVKRRLERAEAQIYTLEAVCSELSRRVTALEGRG